MVNNSYVKTTLEGIDHAVEEESLAVSSRLRRNSRPIVSRGAHFVSGSKEKRVTSEEGLDQGALGEGVSEDKTGKNVALSVRVVGDDDDSTKRAASKYDSMQLDEAATSDCSLETVRTRTGSMSSEEGGRFWAGRKRRRVPEPDSDPSDDERATTEPLIVRARGRPPTSGKYVGLAKAQAALNAAKKEELRLMAEEDLMRSVSQSRERRMKGLSESSSDMEATDPAESVNTVAKIQKQVEDDVAIITKVATKSGKLKGTFVRELKDAAASIKRAVSLLSSRTISDETRQLQADNTRLQTEMTSLRKELSLLKEDMERARKQGCPTSSPSNTTNAATPVSQPSHNEAMEELCSKVMTRVGVMVNARLASIDDRLLPEKRLRPPLAAEKKKEAGSGATTKSPPPAGPGSSLTEEMLLPGSKEVSSPQAAGKKKKKKEQNKKKGKGKKEGITGDVAAPRPLPPAPSSLNEGWNVVARRGSKKKTVDPAGTPKSKTKSTTTQGQKLRKPRSSAVVITLQPGAEERGVTYAKVIAQAQQGIALTDLGITGLRFRKAATGARIFEVPGANSGDKADALAQKIRTLLGDDVVWVSRPTKCAELRIYGLDDATTSADVVTAVAAAGDCSADQVRAGDISRGSDGLGSIWLRCPVAAAKKLAGNGKLLIGWVSANVKLLDVRPMRCFRCWELGHLRAQCTAEVDRSNECYRCGQVGHKAGVCRAAPHCNICAMSDKPANHKSGGKACLSLRGKGKKGRRKIGSDGPRVPSQSVTSPSNCRAEEVPMAVE